MRIDSDNLPTNVCLITLLALAGVGFVVKWLPFAYIPRKSVELTLCWALPSAVAVAATLKYRTDIKQFQLAVLYKQFGIAICLLPPLFAAAIWPLGWFAVQAPAVIVEMNQPASTEVTALLISMRHLSRHFAKNQFLIILGEQQYKIDLGVSMASLQPCFGHSVKVTIKTNILGSIIEDVHC